MQLNKLIDQMNIQPPKSTVSGPAGSLVPGLLSGVAGGALTSALLSKKGRKHLGGAAKLGGAAVLGGLAWKAYSKYNQRQRGAPPPEITDTQSQAVTHWGGLSEQEFRVDEQTDRGRDVSLLLIRAMIAAAHADGHLDDDERGRILQRASQDGLNPEQKALVLEELQQPRRLSEIVAMVNDRETAIEVYLASALALEDCCQKGKDYLRALEFVLELPHELVRQLNREVSTNLQ